MILWRHYMKLNLPPKTSSYIQEINSSMMMQLLIRVFCYMQANILGTKKMMQEVRNSTLLIFKFLINWYLRQWRMHISEGNTQYMDLLFLATHLYRIFRIPHEQRTPAEPQCMKCKETYKIQKVNVLQLRLFKRVEREALTGPKGHSLYLNQNLL